MRRMTQSEQGKQVQLPCNSNHRMNDLGRETFAPICLGEDISRHRIAFASTANSSAAKQSAIFTITNEVRTN